MAWWQIALYVLTTVISYKLRQRPEAPRASTLEDVTLPTADAARIIPKLYGTKWIHGANVLWYGDLRTQAVTKKGGRKYGLFGPKESITVGYKYSLGMHLGLCHTSGVKTILGINFDDREAWRGYAGDGDRIIVDEPELFGGEEREGGVSGRIDVQLGKPEQTVNEYLAQHLPEPHPGYRGIVGLVMRRFYIGTSTYMKPMSVLASSIIDKPFTSGAEWRYIPTDDFYGANESGPARGWNCIGTDDRGVWILAVETKRTGTGAVASILRSSDDGATWSEVFTFNLTGASYSVGGIATNREGTWVVTARMASNTGVILVSFDNGLTWERRSPNPSPCGYYSVHFMDTSRVFIMSVHSCPSNNEALWRSVDGVVWTGPYREPNYTSQGTSRAMAQAFSTGTICSAQSNTSMNDIGVIAAPIIRSQDGGVTWRRVYHTGGQSPVLNGIATDGVGRWIATTTTPINSSGNVTLVFSDDDGETWEPRTVPTNAGRGGPFVHKIAYVGNSVWMLFGDSQFPAPNIIPCILRSIDNGETWELCSVDVPSTSFNAGFSDVEFTSDGRRGIAVSSAPSAIRLYETIGGPKPDILNGDMNPADIIIDALTDKVSGLGQPTESITTGDAFGSFDYARQLFNQEFLGLSFLESSQGRVEEFIRSVQEHADCAVQVDPFTGKWICVPIRDDYDPDEIPAADESVVKELVSFRRPGYGDLINEVTVVYDDRVTGKQQSVTVQNSALLAVQGVVSAQTNTYPGISRADTAMKIASRDLRQLSTPLAEVELTLLPAFGSQLRVGSVFKFDWDPLGITGMILRVVEINYGDLINGEVYVKAMEDVFATAQALYEPPPATAWTPPTSEPEPVDASLTMEAPYALLISDILGEGSQLDEALDNGNGFPLAQVEQPTGDSIDYFIHTSANGGEFSQDGQANFTSRLIIPEVLPAEIESEITFPSDVSLVDATVGSFACLNGEWVKIKGKSGQTITLARGIFDTTPRRHFAGASLWLTGDTGFGFGDSAFSDGDSVAVRYTAQTALGVLPISELDETVSPETGEVVTPAIEDSVTFASRASRPYPPGDFKVGGERYPSQMELIAPIEVTWAHRDRISQGEELVEQDESDIGPEDGTTYRLKVTGISGSTLLDESGITDTSFQLQDEHIADVGIIIELWSVRDGLESFEPQRCQVLTATGLGFALGLNLGGIGLTYEKFYSEASANHSFNANRATLFYCPTNNKVYSNDRVYDADTGEQVKQYPRRQYEDLSDISGYRMYVIEWFWAEAYLESEDEVVGRLFRYKTYTRVSSGTTFNVFEKTKMKINKTTHEPEAL